MTITQQIENGRDFFKPTFLQKIAHKVYGVSNKFNQWQSEFSLLSRHAITRSIDELNKRKNPISRWLLGLNALSVKLEMLNQSIDENILNEFQTSERRLPGKIVARENYSVERSLFAKQNVMRNAPKVQFKLDSENKPYTYRKLREMFKGHSGRVNELRSHIQVVGHSESRDHNLYESQKYADGAWYWLEQLRLKAFKVRINEEGTPSYYQGEDEMASQVNFEK